LPQRLGRGGAAQRGAKERLVRIHATAQAITLALVQLALAGGELVASFRCHDRGNSLRTYELHGHEYTLSGKPVRFNVLGHPLLQQGGGEEPQSVTTGMEWEPWSEERVDELRARSRNVFVNFTADWCVSCLVNDGWRCARLQCAKPSFWKVKAEVAFVC
jgi:thiol:disulfide interchange protein